MFVNNFYQKDLLFKKYNMYILKIFKNKKNLQYLTVSLILILAISLSYNLEFKNTYSYPQNGEKLLG